MCPPFANLLDEYTHVLVEGLIMMRCNVYFDLFSCLLFGGSFFWWPLSFGILSFFLSMKLGYSLKKESNEKWGKIAKHRKPRSSSGLVLF